MSRLVGSYLRAGIPLAFKPGPPQSLAASSGSSGLAGHAGCPGPAVPLVTGRVGPSWDLWAEGVLGCTGSPTLLSSVFVADTSQLLRICEARRGLCARGPPFRKDLARDGLRVCLCTRRRDESISKDPLRDDT